MRINIKPLGKVGAFGLACLLLLSSSPSMAGYNNSLSPMGINTNEVMDDDASAPFVDVFRGSTPFEEARPWLTKGNIAYDKNGWPIRLNGGQVGARFINKLPAGTIPDGKYTVLYDGEGRLQYGNDAKFVSKSPGREIITITAGPDREIRATLLIMETNTKNPIRNIRILMPGGICSNNPYKRVYGQKSCRGSQYMSFDKHYSRVIFNPDYLNYMKDFKVLRFMNMAGITRNPIKEWHKRPLMTQSTWGGKPTVRGAPLEIMVELANQSNADAWFSLPHAANDHYMRQYAQYLRKHLKPGLKAYIEYTNEAWNTIFDQAHYMKDMGLKLGLDTDRDKAGYKYYSMRSVQVFRIFEQEFGGTQRLVRVMGGWTGYTKLSKMLLSYRDAYKYTDAFAIGPYFYGSSSALKKIKSTNDIFKMIYDKSLPFSIPGVGKLVRAHAKIAKSYGVSLIAYEGGQHLVDWKNRDIKQAPTKYYIAANRDWRMAKAYKDFLDEWKKAGGELFISFSAPRTYQWFGSWGTREYLTQSDRNAPKHRAILSFIKNNRCWWKNCTNAQIARLPKPARNPDRGVYETVISKTNIKYKPPVTKAKKPAPVKQAAKPVKRAAPKQVARAPVVIPPKVARRPVQRAAPVKVVKKPVPRATPPVARAPARRAPAPVQRQVQRVAQAPRAPVVIPPRPQVVNRHDGIIKQRRHGRDWANQPTNQLRNIVGGSIVNGQDLAAIWQTSWDNRYLHVRVDTTDDRFVKDSAAPWSDDSIEVFVDADGSRGTQFDGRNDFHFIFRWRDHQVNLSQSSPRRANLGVIQSMTRNNKGYTLEASIPWSTLGVHPQQGAIIGLEVQVNDDDTGSGRDGKLAWFSRDDNAWKNPQNFARMLLSN